MNVIVNYPDANNEKQLQLNVAKFKAILIKESIDKMNINTSSKREVLEIVLKKFKGVL